MDTLEDLRLQIPTASFARDQVQKSVDAKNLQTEIELLTQFKDCIYSAIKDDQISTSVSVARGVFIRPAYHRVKKTLEEKGYTINTVGANITAPTVKVMVHWD